MRLVMLLLGFAVGLIAILLAASIGGTIYGALQQANAQVLAHINSQKVQPVVSLTVTAFIEPNTTVAPHLYDWYFNGINAFILYEGYDYPLDDAFSAVTIAVRFKDVEYTTWKKLAGFLHGWPPTGGCIQVGEGGSNDYYAQVSNGTRGMQSIGYGANLGRPLNWKWSTDGFYTVAWAYDAISGKLFGYRDDGWMCSWIVAGPAYGDLLGGFTHVCVARNYWTRSYWKGYISFIVLSDVMDATDVLGTLNGNTVLSTAIVLLDPTFYDGTYYFDLVSGNIGKPYGGVQRIPAVKKWLWVVRGVASDGKVHFEWFPAGSVVEVYNATSGGLVARFVCLGEQDVALDLPNGTYRIVAKIPVPHTVTVDGEDVMVTVPESWGDVKFNVTVVQPLDYIAPGDLVEWDRGVITVVHGGYGGEEVLFSGFPSGARVYLQVPGGTEWYLFTSDGGNETVRLPLIFNPSVRVDVAVTAPAPLTVKVERGAAIVETEAGTLRLEEGDQVNLYTFSATIAPAPTRQVYPTVAGAVAVIAPWITVILALALVAVFAYTRRR